MLGCIGFGFIYNIQYIVMFICGLCTYAYIWGYITTMHDMIQQKYIINYVIRLKSILKQFFTYPEGFIERLSS